MKVSLFLILTTVFLFTQSLFAGKWLEIEDEDNSNLVFLEKEYSVYLIIEEINGELTI